MWGCEMNTYVILLHPTFDGSPFRVHKRLPSAYLPLSDISIVGKAGVIPLLASTPEEWMPFSQAEAQKAVLSHLSLRPLITTTDAAALAQATHTSKASLFQEKRTRNHLEELGKLVAEIGKPQDTELAGLLMKGAPALSSSQAKRLLEILGIFVDWEPTAAKPFDPYDPPPKTMLLIDPDYNPDSPEEPNKQQPPEPQTFYLAIPDHIRYGLTKADKADRDRNRRKNHHSKRMKELRKMRRDGD